MSSPRVGNPRVGVSASCPVTMQIICTSLQTNNHASTSPLVWIWLWQLWRLMLRVLFVVLYCSELECIDVTVPVQSMVKNSQLVVPAGTQLVCKTFHAIIVLWELPSNNKLRFCRCALYSIQETQLSLRDRATRACQLKSGKVLHKCRRLVFEKVWN